MKIYLVALITTTLAACSSHPLEAPSSPAFVNEAPDNWLQAQAEKSQEKIEYIQSHQTAYDWFANFAFSEVDGLSLIHI